LTLSTKSVHVSELEAERHVNAKPGEYVCLCVHDTGVGMKPEVQARVFEPFFTTKEPGKAMGLGLAAAFGQVRQHQGWIECDSRRAAGTDFRILLPRAPHSTGSTVAVQPPKLALGERVLFVEPNEQLRTLGRMALDRQGYEVAEADSASIALTLWRAQSAKINILFTDISLPAG